MKVIVLVIALLGIFVAGSFFGIGWVKEYNPREVIDPYFHGYTTITPAEPEIIYKETIVEVERIIRVNQDLRDFASRQEFKDKMHLYSSALTILGGTCVETARSMVEVARMDGYYLDTEMENSETHMVNKGFIPDGIGLYDLESNSFRWKWK